MNTTPSSKPDAEQYARVLLWHLCTIQASLQIIQSDAIRLAGEGAGASVDEILGETSKHGKLIRKLAEPLYRDALQQANIKPSPKFPHSSNT